MRKMPPLSSDIKKWRKIKTGILKMSSHLFSMIKHSMKEMDIK